MASLGSGAAAGGSSAPEVTQVTQMPLPPQFYYSNYTDENIRRGRAPKPPPPPQTSDTYQMFGVTFHADDAIIRPLESQGIRRLYPQNFDHRRELKKLNHSVLTNFLDLLDILIQSPESQKRQEKIDDISLLFIHMHHLINEFRPHQARETLRVMMEVQKRQTLETCDRFQKHLEKCVDVIKQALNNLPEQCDSDSKLLASTEMYLTKNKEETSTEPAVSSEDKMMCDIVDSM
ncbi:Mediator of RNA polymerase II transcription subunit 7 [Orchesella cincta]|uniref:Mediator of RNA polymerase II transcription subunit 7 n=1 Tax=Orchesella cincta TaxID=48709 RepID=A0A1D2NL32_ORCCI|nr:Mediator of RNA polymerase II transcription subunit 7 [Orchesella cincta]